MSAHRKRAGARFVAIAAIAAVALGWVPVAGEVGPARAAPSVARGNGLRARPSVRVRAAQRSLRRLGYHLSVDGRFGRLTVLAVLRYQSRHGLRSDGVVGRATRRALRRSVARVERLARRARRRRARARGHGSPRPPAREAGTTRVPPAGVVPPVTTAVPPVAAPAAPALPHVPRPLKRVTGTARAGGSASDARVLLTIGALAAVLFIAAAPLLREPLRWGSSASGRRAARAGAAGGSWRRPGRR